MKKMLRIGALGALMLLASGCVLVPRSWRGEYAELARAGEKYEKPFEKRELPELPANPEWRDVLRRALLANGDLEASYHEWAMAMARVQQAGAWPNSSLSVSFEYMFSGERLKAWDRTSVTVAPDAMQNLTLPTKTYQAAKVALRDAQGAGQKFIAAKLELQRQVLSDYLDYALLAETTRIHRENTSLLKLIYDITRQRAGDQQADLLRAEVGLRTAENQIKSNESELAQKRAKLNAMLAREPDAPLPPPEAIPAPRAVPMDDAHLLLAASENNPELAALAKEVTGRRDAIELARMRYIPDINPMAGFTGSMEQFLGAMFVLPTVVPQIQGAIKEARSDLYRAQAMYRQKKFDRAASVVAALYELRNAERQAKTFEEEILPRAKQTVDVERQSYAAGSISFTDLIESQRMLLDIRLMIAEAKVAREKSLAELEALAGRDIETLEVHK
jgi:outer membrane protein, heavy metal efflux system